MRDELAGRLLDRLLTWESAEQSRWMADLRCLADYKYDFYEGYSSGQRFFESLARCLNQFVSEEERRRLVTFVRKELVFISRAELNHLIRSVYPDFIKRNLIVSAAQQLNVSPYRVRYITRSTAFRTLRRKTLYLGLSDGARLDRLRRSNPELSHEQFWLSPELGEFAATSMRRKLDQAIDELGLDGEPSFTRVVFVDDFYGSGTSLLYRKPSGRWGGKLARARNHLERLSCDNTIPLVTSNPDVWVIVYIASEQAELHIREVLAAFDSSWQLTVIQRLPNALACRDPDLLDMCAWFFDDVFVDKHKKTRLPVGYADAALPLVLYHNTPNNSISLLWADSTDRIDSEERHALFPRFERHHVDRP